MHDQPKVTQAIYSWKKNEKEEVCSFNEILNKVVLDKIDVFKSDVLNLFNKIEEQFTNIEDEEEVKDTEVKKEL